MTTVHDGGGVIGAAAYAAVENWNVSAPVNNITSSQITTRACPGNITSNLFRNIKTSAPNDKFSGDGIAGVFGRPAL